MQLGEFYSNHTHTNDVTGCIIWDGEYGKGMKPILESPVATVGVRDFVYQSVNGKQNGNARFEPQCENPRCVRLEHIQLVMPEKKNRSYPQEKVTEAFLLYQSGLRQDVIAEKMGIDPSTVSKYIKAAKQQKSEEAAAEQGG